MDFDSIKNKVANLTLYDIKAGVRQVQNAVMNLTEMEAKVREATNADPWGAPSSLMQEIASGTHNYQQLNEIMPLIYKRFTDKTAEEWRQIYKSLQLLEFLIKNGSERVIDDARSHLSLIKMLKQFHYIDENGKDQGLNVRNRANELAKLLSDVDTIRAERKKARANKNKYGGVEGGAGIGSGFSSGGGSRYGGFGSETGGFGGGYSGEVYGDGGGFGGQDPELRFNSTQRHDDEFEEYDAGDDDHRVSAAQPSRKSTNAPSTSTSSTSRAARTYAPTSAPAPKKVEPQPDLFDFGEESTATTSTISPPIKSTNGSTKASVPSNDFGVDDDFDDFQEATSPSAQQSQINPMLASFSPPAATKTIASHTPAISSPPPQASKPSGPNYNLNMSALLSAPAPTPSQSASAGVAPSMGQKGPQSFTAPKTSAPNYYTSVRADQAQSSSIFSSANSASARPAVISNTSTMANLGKPSSTGAPKSSTNSSGSDAFGSIWSSASSKAGIQSKTPASKGMGMAAMQKEKSSAGIWGAASASSGSMAGSGASTPIARSQTPAQGSQKPIGNGLDDLL